MEKLPIYLHLLSGLTAALSIIWFYLLTKSRTFLILIMGWAGLQSIMGISGFYQNTQIMPPRLMLFGILPTLIVIVVVFSTAKGKELVMKINLKRLTYFHAIRILVELVLSVLYHFGLVSVYMSFEGTNFDLFSGLTAPIVGYLAFRLGRTNKKILWFWNIICLLLLLNVVITAIFAFPSPFQQLAFDQPNLAVLYFPFNLLPTVVVPLVLFGHLIAIKQLKTKKID